MTVRSDSFRQTRLKRALRAVKGAGLDVARVEVEPSGKVVIITASGSAVPEAEKAMDDWLAGHARTS